MKKILIGLTLLSSVVQANTYDVTFFMESRDGSTKHEDSYVVKATSVERGFKLALSKCLREHKDSRLPCEVLEIKENGTSIGFDAYSVAVEVYSKHLDYYTTVSKNPKQAYTDAILQCSHEHSGYNTSDDCVLKRMTSKRFEPVSIENFTEDVLPEGLY